MRLKSNDPCWCGSGNKHKRCHGDRRALDRPPVRLGNVSAPRPVPDTIARPDYVTTGTIGTPRDSTDPRRRILGAPPTSVRRCCRGPHPHRRAGHGRQDDRRARRVRPRHLRRVGRVPERPALQGLHEVDLHIGERSHLPRHPRRSATRRRRHRQHRRDRLRRRHARRHLGNVPRRRPRRRARRPRRDNSRGHAARHRRDPPVRTAATNRRSDRTVRRIAGILRSSANTAATESEQPSTPTPTSATTSTVTTTSSSCPA